MDELMPERHQLRVYYGPEDSRSVPLKEAPNVRGNVEIELVELLDTLGDAARKQRTWLNDFQHEKVSISTDLYEIISAYRQLRRSA